LRDVPEAADFLRAEGGFELLRDVPEVELLRGAEFALLRAAEFELLRAGPELRGLELAGAAPVALGAAALPAFGAALCFLVVCLATLPPEVLFRLRDHSTEGATRTRPCNGTCGQPQRVGGLGAPCQAGRGLSSARDGDDQDGGHPRIVVDTITHDRMALTLVEHVRSLARRSLHAPTSLPRPAFSSGRAILGS
ncbi:MAG TPA: hypothetical protein VE449_10385, partial [Thermoleophilaceae bacterium]|nr:hypothetical protein [Thermoleophilaceae bacterium]